MTISDIFRGLLAFVLLSLAVYLTWQRIKDVAERSKQENPQGVNPTQRQMVVIALILGLSLLAGGLVSLLLLFLGR